MVELVTLPGYVTEDTARGAKGRYIGGDNVRFGPNGRARKLKGAQPRIGSAFDGVCRKLHPYKSNDGKPLLALGTHVRFYIDDQGSTVNITPLRDSTAAPFSSSVLSNPFSSTAASDIITVTHAGHGVEVGDYVNFRNASTSPIDGLLIDGTYTVISVPNANTYTIRHSVTATNSESGFGGASVDYDYEINVGQADASVGAGWGGGAWGVGTWGTPRSGSGIFLQLRTVAIQSWGEDTIWNVRSSKIYAHDTSGGITSSNRAVVISGAPITVEYILTTPEERILIAFGAHDGSNPDKMLIRWSDSENYSDFVPSVTNMAGDKRLDQGTRIMSATLTKGQILVHTDTALYGMVFIGYPDVYSVKFIDKNCGLISPDASLSTESMTVWMGNDKKFHKYDGSVSEIPCAIRDHIFNDMNYTQKDKIVSHMVSEMSEMWWGYCSAGSTEIDRWVVYNWALNVFYFGTWDGWSSPRTAMVDRYEGIISTPVGASLNGKLHDHETGYDDGAQPLPSYLQRFWDEVNNGDDIAGVSRYIPDFRQLIGSIDITLKGMKYPQGATVLTKGPRTLTSTTKKKDFRMRARQISVLYETNNLGDYWEIGTERADTFALGKQ